MQYFYEHYLTKCVMLLPTSRTLLRNNREHVEIICLYLCFTIIRDLMAHMTLIVARHNAAVIPEYESQFAILQ